MIYCASLPLYLHLSVYFVVLTSKNNSKNNVSKQYKLIKQITYYIFLKKCPVGARSVINLSIWKKYEKLCKTHIVTSMLINIKIN